ncbi:MAG: dienelactone hydrolase family protein [Thalassolituus sp.]|jgi:dienelactone hydrolase
MKFYKFIPPILASILLPLVATTAQADVCQHEIEASEAIKEAVYFYPCGISELSPAVTLTGGYGNTYRNLQWMAETLSEKGYVVLAMTPTNIYGKVEQWRDAHLAGQKALVIENANTESPLNNRIDIHRRGIAGFSMGGGGTLLAGTELKDDIKALAAFAPFLLQEQRNVSPSAPTMILAGEKDLLVTNESIDEIKGHVTQSADKHLIAVYKNGRHQQWYRAEITTNRESYKAMTLAWFDLYLKGDSEAQKALTHALNKDKDLLSSTEQ